MRAGVERSNKRRIKVGSLTLTAVLAGLAIASAVASAAVDHGCCYRVTIYERGLLGIDYGKVIFNSFDPQGIYNLEWRGVAYAVSRYTDGILTPIKAVSYGYLREFDSVAPVDGSENIYGCSPNQASDELPGGVFHQNADDPVVQLRNHYLSFGAPYYHWHQNCGKPSGAISDLLREVPGWHEELFDTAYLRGFTRQIFHSQHVLCTTHADGSNADVEGGASAFGYIARYINVVHFAPDQLKRQERKLKSFVGKRPPSQDPASRQVDGANPGFDGLDHPPPNGCQAS